MRPCDTRGSHVHFPLFSMLQLTQKRKKKENGIDRTILTSVMTHVARETERQRDLSTSMALWVDYCDMVQNTRVCDVQKGRINRRKNIKEMYDSSHVIFSLISMHMYYSLSSLPFLP